MTLIILFVAAIVLACFPVLRCAVFNIGHVVYNGVIDAYYFYRHKISDICPSGELVAYCGLFGKGKTLSAVHRVVGDYRRYNGKTVWCPRRQKFVTQRVQIISNVAICVPYENFVSLGQIVAAADRQREYDDQNDTLTITLVLGDEFSVQMNSRSFKTNIDPLFLNTLLTCRHYYISLFYTAQRFGHVDALLRQVTSYVADCDKLWRFQRLNLYDAWDLENAKSTDVVKPFRRCCWFVRNRDYAAYNTLACVGNLKKSVTAGDMIPPAEILTLQGNQTSDMDQVAHPSRKWLHRQKKLQGK